MTVVRWLRRSSRHICCCGTPLVLSVIDSSSVWSMCTLLLLLPLRRCCHNMLRMLLLLSVCQLLGVESEGIGMCGGICLRHLCLQVVVMHIAAVDFAADGVGLIAQCGRSAWTVQFAPTSTSLLWQTRYT